MSQMVILKRPTSEAAEIGVVGCRGPTIHTFTNDTVPFCVARQSRLAAHSTGVWNKQLLAIDFEFGNSCLTFRRD